jgi:NTE family protein
MQIPSSTPKPYRLGVCLSGGGARGFAHIGAMHALREYGLIPDIIAGVSAGSVVAAFYASGLLNDINNDPLLTLFSNAQFRNFAEMHIPRESFFSLERFRKILEKELPYKNTEDLPIKTLICATEIDQGTKVAFTNGPLAESIVASCSIPIVFEPVTINGHRYVDGGVLRNLPAWALRHQCDYLIGINCSPLYSPEEPASNILEIAQRSYSLMSRNNINADLEMCDLVISLTETANHQVFSLKDIQNIKLSGYRTAVTALKKLR